MTATAKNRQTTKTLCDRATTAGHRTGHTQLTFSKHNQAILHTNVVPCNPRSGAATTSKDDCEYVKFDEVTLPDGTKMSFHARKENAPTFDEIMDEVYDLAAEALVRKLSK